MLRIYPNSELYFWAPAYNWVAKGIEQHRLERRLAAIVNVANGHEAAGESAGSEVYKALHAEAQASIQEFCRSWQISEDKVYRQLPMLKQLERLAEASPPRSKGVYLLAVVLIAGFVPAVLAILRSEYVHLLRWFGVQ